MTLKNAIRPVPGVRHLSCYARNSDFKGQRISGNADMQAVAQAARARTASWHRVRRSFLIPLCGPTTYSQSPNLAVAMEISSR